MKDGESEFSSWEAHTIFSPA